MLQQARPDAGELKRLYVRPEAAGNRLGKALVDMRIEAAREMGWRTLLVNTPNWKPRNAAPLRETLV